MIKGLEYMFEIDVYIKETTYFDCGIKPKQIMKGFLDSEGVSVITPKFPMGLFHTFEEVFVFKSVGKRRQN